MRRHRPHPLVLDDGRQTHLVHETHHLGMLPMLRDADQNEGYDVAECDQDGKEVAASVQEVRCFQILPGLSIN